jgi:hypothetical protein
MKRLIMVLSVAALMAAMMLGSALPAFAVPCGEFGDLPADVCADVMDPNFWAANATPLRTIGPAAPIPIDDPANCPAGTVSAPTSDPAYGGPGHFVCE